MWTTFIRLALLCGSVFMGISVVCAWDWHRRHTVFVHPKPTPSYVFDVQGPTFSWIAVTNCDWNAMKKSQTCDLIFSPGIKVKRVNDTGGYHLKITTP